MLPSCKLDQLADPPVRLVQQTWA